MDNEIDFRCWGPGFKRRHRERDARRHARHNEERATESRERLWTDKADRTERLKTESPKTGRFGADRRKTDCEKIVNPMRGIKDTKSRVMVLALKYPKFAEAYKRHEREIGSHLSRVTLGNLHRETRHALKLFESLGLIDQRALKRYRRDK